MTINKYEKLRDVITKEKFDRELLYALGMKSPKSCTYGSFLQRLKGYGEFTIEEALQLLDYINLNRVYKENKYKSIEEYDFRYTIKDLFYTLKELEELKNRE